MNLPLPAALLDSLAGSKGYDPDAFIAVHGSGRQVTSIRINPGKIATEEIQRHLEPVHTEPVPWSRYGLYLSERPSFTFDPLFHAGTYYVQEASSMFVEQALITACDLTSTLHVLDLCAAPGGKSTHLQSLISKESLLVSNEVIRARTNILKDNIIKWGGGNVVVTYNDPKDFESLEGFFDVMVVDAPCSGSGLFRREPEAIAEWSEQNVALCSQRQQRILADAWPALKPGGVLIYSTCSYSTSEDEEILDWLCKELDAESVRVPVKDGTGIIESELNGAYGYRFWPDKVKGEGFFLCCLRKKTGSDAQYIKIRKKPTYLTAAEKTMAAIWLDIGDMALIKHEQTVYAWPEAMADVYSLLMQQLRVSYSGIRLGELMRDKMVPDHALAMSGRVGAGIVRAELEKAAAIAYLQRKDLPEVPPGKGWQLAAYQGHPLGWMNVLPNRVNNYYPRDLRILKDSPGAGTGKNSTSL